MNRSIHRSGEPHRGRTPGNPLGGANAASRCGDYGESTIARWRLVGDGCRTQVRVDSDGLARTRLCSRAVVGSRTLPIMGEPYVLVLATAAGHGANPNARASLPEAHLHDEHTR